VKRRPKYARVTAPVALSLLLDAADAMGRVRATRSGLAPGNATEAAVLRMLSELERIAGALEQHVRADLARRRR
jgi:hypothetical protein